MELGSYLIEELKVESRADTLGHWMAHYLAQLIDAAESEQDTVNKAQAAKDVIETILKLWEHRAHLPGSVNPLAPYREILEVLTSLRPNADLWAGQRLDRKGKLARDFYRMSLRIMMGFLTLQTFGKTKSKNERSRVAVRKLSPEEKGLLKEADNWMAFVKAKSKVVEKKAGQGENNNDPRQRIHLLVLSWVDDATNTLQSIRSELSGVGQPQP